MDQRWTGGGRQGAGRGTAGGREVEGSWLGGDGRWTRGGREVEGSWLGGGR